MEGGARRSLARMDAMKRRPMRPLYQLVSFAKFTLFRRPWEPLGRNRNAPRKPLPTLDECVLKSAQIEAEARDRLAKLQFTLGSMICCIEGSANSGISGAARQVASSRKFKLI